MFAPTTYRSRRRTLVAQERPESGLVLLLGNQHTPRNYVDNPYPFQQDGTFLYYFGLDRPNLYGLIDLDMGTSTLYGEEATLDDVVWAGEPPALQEEAAAVGVDTVNPPSTLGSRLTQARQQDRTVHILPPYRDEHRLRLGELLNVPHAQLDDAISEPLIQAVVQQRSVKSSEEVAEIETALERTAQVHACAQAHAVPGASEQEIVGAMTGRLTAEGSAFSFTPTCSVRGEVLHNHSYPNTLTEGDLLLVDAGAVSPRRYAGDVTRVTPVAGTFASRQEAIYRAVLSAQAAAIEALAPDVPFVEIHKHAARTLTEHLIDLGLMQGPAGEAVAAGAHALFFPHGLGHMMGLDVHDMESLGEEFVGYTNDQTRPEQFGLHALRLGRPLHPGFVVTVEPGCYFIPPLIKHWRAEQRHEQFINYERVEDFLGFGGIRIEDDFLVTADGARALGPDIPKAPEKVAARAGSSPLS
ncbi:aminopeptidase P family protein [Salinibacter altiplanensis]|uniref:aminopeptidase P family protein n=1 Tax=Salinibacter altiplanensis TaxID=1803181 RepID=UPI000C9FF5D3|nr:aminopeptidase P family protein [Salinibacter altiplanensis]